MQHWLNRLPYNWERGGETASTFRGVVHHRKAHCMEAALFAATVLEQHGHPPLLLDIESRDELDHVLYLFKRGRSWGTIGMSRDPGLSGRKPVFRSVRDVVQSYVAPYIDRTGRVEGYGVLDLRDLPTQRWRFAEGNVWHVEQALIDNDHTPFATSERTYRYWRWRFDEWWTAHGRPDREWPAFADYPYRKTWMWP